MTEQHHTLAIMLIGSGKSIAYEVPPIFQGQAIIVIILYKAIISQVLQNTRSHKVKAEHWEAKTTRNH